ncbi:MAG: twin-arginine translocase TatA/TatE family subunit [Candidatus Thorarchaeota archaeon]
MFGIGPTELIIISVIGIILFGKRLPEVANKDFKEGINE